MPTATGLTIDDFERLPQALAHNHELVDGELIDGPFVEHDLGIVLCEQEFDFAGNAHGPDLAFISEARRPLLNWNLRVQRQISRGVSIS